MRIRTNPPTNPFPSNLHPGLIRDVFSSHGSSQDQVIRPTHLTAGAGRIATQRPSHRPVAASEACDPPYTQRSPPVPGHSHATADVHRGVSDSQTVRSVFPSIPYPEFRAAPTDTTIQRCTDPPPLNFSKSPYCCIPLPKTSPGPATLNPILAYTDCRTAQNESNVSQRRSVDVYRHHICAPATTPSVGSATLLLPDGTGITVHASHRGHSFVTVGDVLDGLDMLLLGKPSRELSLPVEEIYGSLAGSCPCLSGTTALHSLRSRYERAGLVRSEEGFDIWDLRIG